MEETINSFCCTRCGNAPAECECRENQWLTVEELRANRRLLLQNNELTADEKLDILEEIYNEIEQLLQTN